jgi:beta-lactamase superfamily II metal-dependent hydrolase
MAYDIDYMPVGDGSKSGDAIAVRFGNLTGAREEQTVVIIDGGTKDSGELLVQLVLKHYGTDTVDFIISTHPDADHASGLTVVLEKLKVGMLVMHRPWEHAADIKSMFKNGRLTVTGLEENFAKSLQNASDLEDLATKKGIKIVEPFAGVKNADGSVVILGPSLDYYQSLLPNFRQAPEAKAEVGFVQKFVSGVKEAAKMLAESLDIETLDDTGETSAENNTSAIVLFTHNGKRLLFTGDAGIPAINAAIQYAESNNINVSNLDFLDVPHHGSKRNIGPTILNKLRPKLAYVSAAPEGEPKHPAKKVTNALHRRGCVTYVTQGKSIWHHCDAPAREGYGPITPIPFYEQVEE